MRGYGRRDGGAALQSMTFPDACRAGRRARVAVAAAIILVLSCVAWRSINDVSGDGYMTDSGVFASTARHIIAGRVLYRDVFDHKPPMVHFIDALALWIGDGTIDSIRFTERLFAVARGLLFFLVAWRAFGSRAISFVATLAFILHFHHPSVFQGGNLTEEYGSVFVLAGVSCVLLARNADVGKARFRSLCALSGMCFSLAIFTKEPFLFSAIPWFLHLSLPCPGGKPRNARASAYFLGGALVPLLVFLLYLLPAAALGDWIDVLSFNLRTSVDGDSSVSLPGRVLANYEAASKAFIGLTATARMAFLLGVASLAFRSFVKKYDYVPLTFAATFVLDYCGTMLSGRGYGHYYMQLAASFFLVGCCAAAFVAHRIEKERTLKAGLFVASLALVAFVDRPAYADFAKRLSAPSERGGISDISRFVMARTAPDDLVWSPGHVTALYAETGRLSPTKYQYAFSHLFVDTWKSTRAQKIESLRMDLSANPPRVIVLDAGRPDAFVEFGVADWVSANYRTRTESRDGRIFTIAEYNGPPGPQDRRRRTDPLRLRGGIPASR